MGKDFFSGEEVGERVNLGDAAPSMLKSSNPLEDTSGVDMSPQCAWMRLAVLLNGDDPSLECSPLATVTVVVERDLRRAAIMAPSLSMPGCVDSSMNEWSLATADAPLARLSREGAVPETAPVTDEGEPMRGMSDLSGEFMARSGEDEPGKS